MDRAPRSHGARQVFGDKTGPTADIKRAFPGLRGDSFKQRAPLGHDFRRTVSQFKMAQRFFVKLLQKGNLR